MIKTISWVDDAVVMIDQRALPRDERYLTCGSHREVVSAINDMAIRGAPAIGIAAAMGIALGVYHFPLPSKEKLRRYFYAVCDEFSKTRPTAVNLFWAIKRMRECFENASGSPSDFIKEALKAEAIRICEEDIRINRQIGANGEGFIKEGDTVLTHCNAGALATGGYGTALGVIRSAHENGKNLYVFADETRPVLQGARLTAWEMKKEGIPVTVITDNMAGFLMKQGRVDLVIVGADRIAANGDTANKIGTYSLAVLAKEHEIPFYVAVPLSTVDMEIKSGDEIPIEQRDEAEVLSFMGMKTTPEGVLAYNPAFDVTPAKYITAVITEAGVAVAPLDKSIGGFFKQ
jgi:methylthioribose-1-phosphate isomerase